MDRQGYSGGPREGGSSSQGAASSTYHDEWARSSRSRWDSRTGVERHQYAVGTANAHGAVERNEMPNTGRYGEDPRRSHSNGRDRGDDPRSRSGYHGYHEEQQRRSHAYDSYRDDSRRGSGSRGEYHDGPRREFSPREDVRRSHDGGDYRHQGRRDYDQDRRRDSSRSGDGYSSQRQGHGSRGEYGQYRRSDSADPREFRGAHDSDRHSHERHRDYGSRHQSSLFHSSADRSSSRDRDSRRDASEHRDQRHSYDGYGSRGYGSDRGRGGGRGGGRGRGRGRGGFGGRGGHFGGRDRHDSGGHRVVLEHPLVPNPHADDESWTGGGVVRNGHVTLALRPSTGSKGTPSQVSVNVFVVPSFPETTLYQYSISVFPKCSPTLIRPLFEWLEDTVPDWRQCIVAFDGRQTMYSLKPLALGPNGVCEFPTPSPEEIEELRERVVDVTDPQPRKIENPSAFTVRVKSAASITTSVLHEFLQKPQETNDTRHRVVLHCFDVLVRHALARGALCANRSIYNPENKRFAMPGGSELWSGFFRAYQPLQAGLGMQMNVSLVPVVRTLNLVQFVAETLDHGTFFKRGLNDREVRIVQRELKALKVRTLHRGGKNEGKGSRKYKISGVTFKSAEMLYLPSRPSTWEDSRGPPAKYTRQSVASYFREKYGPLQYPHLPCVDVGKPRNPIYLPLEVCELVPGQVKKTMANPRQLGAMVQASCQRPGERKEYIKQGAQMLSTNRVLDGFGINPNPEMLTLEARILPIPLLEYRPGSSTTETSAAATTAVPAAVPADVGEIGTEDATPGVMNGDARPAASGDVDEAMSCDRDGSVPAEQPTKASVAPVDGVIHPVHGVWRIEGVQFMEPAAVSRCAVISFSPASDIFTKALEAFLSQLTKTGHALNMNLPLASSPVAYYHPEQTERAFQDVCAKFPAAAPGSPLPLVLVILPDAGSRLYAEVKRLGETVHGVCTQCVILKSVLGTPYPEEMMETLCLKMNMKVGGISYKLQSGVFPERFQSSPVMVCGADVHHPTLGNRSFPSIAAIVASMDPSASRYAWSVRPQKSRQELIQDTEAMMTELLQQFVKQNGFGPKHIVFYRDGVPVGQFEDVLIHELEGIRRACQKQVSGYRTCITFVVLQKRHNIRFFADTDNVTATGNVVPGTVVDTSVCHPHQYDFFLCSHYNIRGTMTPTRYHVLVDENAFQPDEIQELTFRLCHMYARCSRSVCIPAPAYYAHYAASHGRYHTVQVHSQDTLSASSVLASGIGVSGLAQSRAPPQMVPVHPNLIGSMCFI